MLSRLLVFASLVLIFSTANAQYDILIRNGRIIDGTGNSWYYADVAVSKGKIAAMG